MAIFQDTLPAAFSAVLNAVEAVTLAAYAIENAVEAVLYATVAVEFAATVVEFATAAVVLAKSATLATAYNCEPLIASVDVLPTNPAAIF